MECVSLTQPKISVLYTYNRPKGRFNFGKNTYDHTIYTISKGHKRRTYARLLAYAKANYDLHNSCDYYFYCRGIFPWGVRLPIYWPT